MLNAKNLPEKNLPEKKRKKKLVKYFQNSLEEPISGLQWASITLLGID